MSSPEPVRTAASETTAALGDEPHERQQAALLKLSRQALVADDIDELMCDAAVLVGETLQVDFSSVMELDAGGRNLLVRNGASVSRPREFNDREVKFLHAVADVVTMALHNDEPQAKTAR